MPVYKIAIKGSTEKPRYVRASTPAKAREHIVETESVNADQLADAMADGATIERVVEAPTSEAKPAGETAQALAGTGADLGAGAQVETKPALGSGDAAVDERTS